jgi:DNA integrity scanning protein DisA with diadenylate cyclase activity
MNDVAGMFMLLWVISALLNFVFVVMIVVYWAKLRNARAEIKELSSFEYFRDRVAAAKAIHTI